jgi:hypothetical protein
LQIIDCVWGRLSNNVHPLRMNGAEEGWRGSCALP